MLRALLFLFCLTFAVLLTVEACSGGSRGSGGFGGKLREVIGAGGCTDDPRCERSIKTIENNPHREAVIKKLCDNGQVRDLCPKTCNAC